MPTKHNHLLVIGAEKENAFHGSAFFRCLLQLCWWIWYLEICNVLLNRKTRKNTICPYLSGPWAESFHLCPENEQENGRFRPRFRQIFILQFSRIFYLNKQSKKFLRLEFRLTKLNRSLDTILRTFSIIIQSALLKLLFFLIIVNI